MLSFWSKFLNKIYLARRTLADFVFVLWRFVYVRVYLAVIFVFGMLTWILAYYIDSRTQENALILHYNVDFGVNLIGEVVKIYTIPAAGFVLSVLNLLIAYRILKFRPEKLLVHFLFASALIANIILLVALGTLYLINFR